MDACAEVDSWLVDMEFESCLTEEFNKATFMNNIPSTINSLWEEDITKLLVMDGEDEDGLGQPPPTSKQIIQQKANDDYPSAADHNNNIVLLNFETGNSSSAAAGSNSLLKSRGLNDVEEAFVSEVLRSQDHNNNSNNSFDGNNYYAKDQKLTCVEAKTKKASRVRLPSQNQDHVIAERKRREQLSQKFLALSTMVPGLKKMDKASVLNDAIKYLKHLQDKVKTLEALAEKHTVESFVLVKKSKTMMLEDEGDDDGDERFGEGDGEETTSPLPEIKASLYNNNQLLIKIQCHKRLGVMADLFGELEKLKLRIVSTNAVILGNFALDATIMAETGTDFDLTTKEVVKRLRAVVQS